MRSTRAKFWIFLACTLVYGRAVTGGYLNWDDIQHFEFNTWLKDGDLLHFWSHAYYGLYIPVTYTLWTLLYHATGGVASAQHMLNLFIHALSSILVYQIAAELSPKAKSSDALFAGLFFALHPLHVEPVAWISGGRDLQSAFFGLLALLFVLKQRHWLGTLAFAVGLLCKPTLAPLAFALILVPLDARMRLSRPRTVAWTVLACTALALATWIQEPFAQLRVPPVAWWQRGWIALDALGFYLKQIVFPWPLAADYGRTPSFVLEPSLFISWTIPCVLLAGFSLWWTRKHANGLYLKYALFAVLLLTPVLGLVPFEAQVQSTVFDRYLYLPLVVVALAIAPVSRRWLIPLLTVYAVVAFLRVDVWLNNQALFSDILEKSPNSYFAHVNLAIEDLKMDQLKTAENHLKRARELDPKLALAPANLAHVYWQERNFGAILSEMAPLTQNADFLFYNQHEPQALALLFRMVGRSHSVLLDTVKARQEYKMALLYSPSDVELRHEVELFNQEHSYDP